MSFRPALFSYGNMKEVQKNSFRAWVLAARPKTLTGAAAPVLIGGSYALYVNTFSLVPFLLCLFFAFLMQVDANFINDWFDFQKGTDREDRLGPERACAQGWISPSAMKRAIFLTSLVACCVGLPLVMWGGWMLVGIGALCVAGAFLYTMKLSYLGLGDVLVILFFGLIPVFFTWYVIVCETPSFTRENSFVCLCLGLATGFVIDTLLMVNNYRDREQDLLSGKKTIMVRVSKKVGLGFYFLVGFIGVVIAVVAMIWSGISLWWIELAYLVLHCHTFWKMKSLEGRALNGILGETSRNIILFALFTCLALRF